MISAFIERTVPSGLKPHRKDNKILVLFLAASAAILGLLWLSSEVLEGDTFAIDKAILLALRTKGNLAVPIGPGWLLEVVRDITALGGETVLTLITIFVVGFLLAMRKSSTAWFVTGAITSGALVGGLLKHLFLRPRPEIVPHLMQATSASFPSGHAMNSAIIYLTLATLLARSLDDQRVRIYLITIAIAVTVAVGISRVYLGVHWPSDVIAGWSVGALWAAVCSLIGKMLQQRQRIEGPSRPPS